MDGSARAVVLRDEIRVRIHDLHRGEGAGGRNVRETSAVIAVRPFDRWAPPAAAQPVPAPAACGPLVSLPRLSDAAAHLGQLLRIAQAHGRVEGDGREGRHGRVAPSGRHIARHRARRVMRLLARPGAESAEVPALREPMMVAGCPTSVLTAAQPRDIRCYWSAWQTAGWAALPWSVGSAAR